MSVQITKLSEFNIENLIFSEAEETCLQNGSIKFKRIYIRMKYPNGKVGPLILESDKCFSWGVQANNSKFILKDTPYLY